MAIVPYEEYRYGEDMHEVFAVSFFPRVVFCACGVIVFLVRLVLMVLSSIKCARCLDPKTFDPDDRTDWSRTEW